jgi:diaminopimelate decarboxylase
VQYIKSTRHKNFVVLDTGMHHLMRPALYQAYHRVLPLEERTGAAEVEYDIVGPICESSDTIGKRRLLPELKAGDFVAIADVGAYGFAMASQYNEHHLPKEIIL